MRSPIKCAALALTLGTLLQDTHAAATNPADPFLWLEDIQGDRALKWVHAQNDRSLAELTQDPRYDRFYASALAIAEDKSRIPLGSLRNGWVYNFWQDDDHVRGIWRRTRVDSYQTHDPAWETLLDVDALAKVDDKSWVFKGALCLLPEGRHCLIQLSNGGQDASIFREFDVEKRQFVPGGFEIPEAKTDVDWADENTLLVATDFGPGTLTDSGYAYIVKQWKRGEPLSAAREIHRGKKTYVGVSPGSLEGEDGRRFVFLSDANTFFTTTYRALGADGTLTLMTLPPKVDLNTLYCGELVFTIKHDWRIGERSYPGGSLLSMPLTDVSKPTPNVRVIWTPGPRDSIDVVDTSAAGVLAASYSNVRGRVLRFEFHDGRWSTESIALPDNGTVQLESVDPQANTAFVSYQNFLQPTTLYSVDVAARKSEPIKNLPAKFDAGRYVVEQLEAISRDGTRVPYFVVRPKAFKPTGGAPTLLYAYGGFQVSMLPTYSGTLGQLWLEHGGIYVLANIRGGGEFGPAWHEAGLKTHRQVVYDDFIAVAEDLIQRKITSRHRLGIQGGSNGGLLMGVMLTQRPDLFHAVVVQVPLLDMLRYHKLLAGASWIDEYGSPEVPAERAWLEKLSPYQNLKKRSDFPEPFIVTSTRDDRVHPGHARKYAAKLQQLGMPFLYYENTEGGHSAAANLRERAKRQALEFTYLSQRLMDCPCNKDEPQYAGR